MFLISHRLKPGRGSRRFPSRFVLLVPLLALLMWLVPLDSADALPWFQSLFDIYPANGSSAAMAPLDFDCNGRIDLVTSAGGILYRFSDGTWFNGPPLPGGFSNRDIATGDFNQDGWPDVIGAFTDSRNMNQLNVYLSIHGTGLDQPLHYPIPPQPQHLVVADFNQDGYPDAVTLHHVSPLDTISVYWGVPGGLGANTRFAPPWPSLYDAVAADFNEDSYPDLAVICATHSSVVAVYFGGPDEKLGTPLNISLPIGTGLAAGDVNGDGHADLVVDGQSTLLGDGKGQFSVLSDVSYGFGGRPSLADVDGDGLLDLVGTGYGRADGFILFLHGAGDGTFGPSYEHSIQNRPYDTYVEDFNGDGLSDMAAVVGSAVEVLTADSLGGFNKVPRYSLPAPTTEAFAVDWNRDGVDDLLSVSASAQSLSILPGLENDFGAWQTFALGFRPGGAVVTDLNGDGILDFAAADGSTNSVRVFLRDSQGNLPSSGTSYAAGSNASDVDHGDFDNDGIEDLVVANYNYPSWSVSYIRGTGAGFFQPTLDIPVAATPASIKVADFNADGNPDFVTAHPGGNFTVVLGRGDGTFNPPTVYRMSTTGFTLPMDVADMNHDGHLDIVCGTGDYGSLSYKPGTGTGTFGTSVSYSIQARTKNLALTDLNSDGYLDILTEAPGGATAGVRFGTATGYRNYESYGAGPAPAWALPFQFDAGPEPEVAVFDDSLTVMILRHVDNPKASVPVDDSRAMRVPPVRILANPARGAARFVMSAPPSAPPGGDITLSVFDVQGRLVHILNPGRTSGGMEFVWRGERRDGGRASDGFYIAALRSRTQAWTVPFIWLK